jgi:hypothetical protein
MKESLLAFRTLLRRESKRETLDLLNSNFTDPVSGRSSRGPVNVVLRAPKHLQEAEDDKGQLNQWSLAAKVASLLASSQAVYTGSHKRRRDLASRERTPTYLSLKARRRG